MTAPTALDRAARALADALGRDFDAMPSTTVRGIVLTQQDMAEAVRAVLAALAEPSPGMVEAGSDAIYQYSDHDPYEEKAVACWRAMLAAAREG